MGLTPGKIIFDCTVGLGGHAEAILEKITPGGKLIGIDKDAEALRIAADRLRRFGDSVILVHDGFENLKTIFEKLGIRRADGFLFDLGVSSLQLDRPERGFSFRHNAFLDMRMDSESGISAADLLGKSNESELDWILENYGEERFHRRIAKAIISERKNIPIETTERLVEVILRALPYKVRHGKIHAATRTFQALRIAANDELKSLESALEQALELLDVSGVICVVSYHSLEDRIVKNRFRQAKGKEVLELLYKKPLRPSEEEVGDNPRARSAKLRAARKLKEDI